MSVFVPLRFLCYLLFELRVPRTGDLGKHFAGPAVEAKLGGFAALEVFKPRGPPGANAHEDAIEFGKMGLQAAVAVDPDVEWLFADRSQGLPLGQVPLSGGVARGVQGMEQLRAAAEGRG